ncbi:MAG: ABC transporter permease [Candidatus Diapherotrites archaeon]|nr:ABC transporter permease [Candidatus Diapherotrites archaeon]
MTSVLFMMWLRQLKRYWRSKPRMIGSLGQPLLFLLALGFGFGPIFEKAGGGSYIQFIAPGIIAMSILFSAMFSGIEVIWDRQFGFLKETLVAPVPRWKIMLGRVLGGASVACMQGLIVFAVCLLIGFRPTDLAGIPLSFVFMFLIAMFFTALGTAIASLLEDMQAFPLIMNFLVMPVFFLSGALFPIEGLSGIIKTVTLLDPLSYGVDGLRASLTGISHIGLVADFLVMLVLTLVTLAVGARIFSRIQI